MKWFLIALMSFGALTAEEMSMLYNKNCIVPTSSYEQMLVKHTQVSLWHALNLQSKLNQTNFTHDRVLNIWECITPSDHLLNNLCSLQGASHLHIGLLKGGSFVAALYGNQNTLNEKIGFDWFQEYPRAQFEKNCTDYLNMENFTIFEGNCFDFDKSQITTPIDIYFYDADHTLTGHELAFTYYDDLFADVFIAVVDDWSFPWIRRPTFKAFEKLQYQVLYEEIIPASPSFGHGQYVAILKKSLLPK
ncbi:MAG: hypothetical protein ACRCU0_06590 [Candidatus Rhabdochlamydia sp.]